MHLRAGSNNRKTLLSHAYKSPFTVHLQHLLHNQRQHMHNFLITDSHLCGLKQQQRNSLRVYLKCIYCTSISLTQCCKTKKNKQNTKKTKTKNKQTKKTNTCHSK